MASLEQPRRITTLDAVNIALSNIGEDPVSSYGQNSKPTAQKAAARLAEESIVVQSAGYNFSTERELELVPSPLTKEIVLPDNAQSWHPVGRSAHLDLTEQGGRLYNRRDSTFKFNQSVIVEAVLARPFEDLPQPARWFITLRAAMAFANSENPGGSYLRVTDAMLAEAEQKLKVFDRRLLKGGLRRNNPHFKRLRGNR